MSDHITSPAQQAAVPTEDPPALQHGAGGHHHDDHNDAHQHQTHHEGSIHENSERIMGVFRDQMNALAEQNTPDSSEEAYKIAHMLLERAELPLAIRARAHIVLASGEMDYLYHAQEAVRIAEMGRRIYGPGKTPEARAAVENLLWEAREVLRRAERDMKELEDIRARKKAGTLKLKKGEKILYGNINDDFYKVADETAKEATSKVTDDKVTNNPADEATSNATNDGVANKSGDEDEEQWSTTEDDLNVPGPSNKTDKVHEKEAEQEKAGQEEAGQEGEPDIDDEVAPEKVTPEKVTPEKVTPEKVTPENVTPEEVTSGEETELARGVGRGRKPKGSSGLITPGNTPRAPRPSRAARYTKNYKTGEPKED